MSHLHAKRGRVAEAERALVATRYERARRIDRETEIRTEPRLTDLFDEETVPRQHIAHGLEVCEVRLHFLYVGPGRSLEGLEFMPARRSRAAALTYDRFDEPGPRRPCVADNRHRRFDARHLRRIDVDIDDLQILRLGLPTKPLQLHAGADADEDIRLGPAPVAGCARESEVVIVRHDASPAAERHDRCLQQTCQFLHLSRGVLGTAPNHDHGVSGRLEQTRRPGKFLRIGLDLRIAIGGRHERHRCGRAEYLPWRFQPDGPRAARSHLPKGFGYCARRFGRVVYSRSPFHDRAHGGKLVRQLVQVALARADEIRRYLPGHAKHRRARAVRRADRRAGVQHPRTRHYREYARSAGGLRVTEGHVCGRLLMARINEADPLPRLVQGVEEPIGLHPGYAEYRIDPIEQERLHNGFAAGHYRSHAVRPGLADGRWWGIPDLRSWYTELQYTGIVCRIPSSSTNLTARQTPALTARGLRGRFRGARSPRLRTGTRPLPTPPTPRYSSPRLRTSRRNSS